ncbi:MAG: response regulator [Veillonellaceae bacterium]|nr:response regulator [Veillonellaceae bacterium]
MLNATRTPTVKKAEILVVDDEPANLQLLAGILNSYGHKVRIAATGEMALRSMCFTPPELVLLDVCLPDLDGYEVCRRIKANSLYTHIPVLFVTALSALEEKVKAFDSGAIDYITKPFHIPEILARITAHLKMSRHQSKLNEQQCHQNIMLQRQADQLSRAQGAIVFAMAQLAEARDPDIHEHLERVRSLCKLLAQGLRDRDVANESVPEYFIDHLHQISALHDIGKTYIPDKVLLKPAKLTDEEKSIVRGHVTFGAQILERICSVYPTEILKMAIDVAKFHHEKWDGSGYPEGLAEKNIPLSARIMGIVDVYDAIRSRRCYKEALPHEVAMAAVIAGRGSDFDPELVDIFVQLAEKICEIYGES